MRQKPAVHRCDPVVLNQIKGLVAPILASDGPAQQRQLARLGYTITQSDAGRYLATLPHGLPLLALD
ncbi:hypothetical protein [uncultured Lentibacter sp.]|jgi:hypothetical protein|uniref:hypothetical protein n=1 Tax=uncultured Lentibacter sp. TaxID=1659309 RepID=UPI0026027F14|nr:hypothetical protein [uncultured Lentibacter sp.]